MVPILLRLDFASPLRQVLLALALATVTGWAWRSGRRRAGPGEPPRLKGAAWAAGVALFSLVPAVFATPEFVPVVATLAQVGTWLLGACFAGTAAAYGWLLTPAGQPGVATPNKVTAALTYGLPAALAAVLAVKLVGAGPVGRGLGLPLHSYGVLVATGFVLGMALGGHLADRTFTGTILVDGVQVPAGPVMRRHVGELGFWIVVGAIGGARALYVITMPDEFRNDWTRVVSLSGGLVFYGGVICAGAAGVLYCLKHQVPLLKMADVAAPTVALGHMFGRLGCFCAGCCWGGFAPEGSRWAVRFPSAAHLPLATPRGDSVGYLEQLHDDRFVDALGHVHEQAVAGAMRISSYVQANGVSMPVYPVQLLEAGGELALFLGLLWLGPRKRFDGQLVAGWLMGYSLLRGVLELFRGDLTRGFLFRWPEAEPMVLSTSQAISVAVFAGGLAAAVLAWRRAPAPASSASPDASESR
ncbi:MAG: prolipoprotein diacylglyceryl transferase [Deltaproteobacteria bacterium]|nr:prolipoprotein diacylglyceryl transferase [Deltaproteobacteria bacterium]